MVTLGWYWEQNICPSNPANYQDPPSRDTTPDEVITTQRLVTSQLTPQNVKAHHLLPSRKSSLFRLLFKYVCSVSLASAGTNWHFDKIFSFISLDGALRIPMTYNKDNNNPILSIHPIPQSLFNNLNRPWIDLS